MCLYYLNSLLGVKNRQIHPTINFFYAQNTSFQKKWPFLHKFLLLMLVFATLLQISTIWVNFKFGLEKSTYFGNFSENLQKFCWLAWYYSTCSRDGYVGWCHSFRFISAHMPSQATGKIPKYLLPLELNFLRRLWHHKINTHISILMIFIAV